MFKIKILTLGKVKEEWLENALTEYEKRLSRICTIHWVLAKDKNRLKRLCEKESFFIALAPNGKNYTSKSFSQKLSMQLQTQHSSLAFLIGGIDGIDTGLLKKAYDIWSLSALTFTHQIARLILLEQIYRAFEIQKGSKYHK